MRHLTLVLILLLALASPAAAQHFAAATAHITSQTTTTVATAVSGASITILGGSICVDANGASTGVAIQDAGGTNLFGTGIVWVIPAGACLNFPYRGFAYGKPGAVGSNLQIVTTVGNGPVEVALEVALN